MPFADKKRILNLLFLFFLSLAMMSCGVAASDEDDEYEIISDEKAAEIQAQFLATPPRLFLYSKPFAERFGLEVAQAVDLDPRLLAVKFEIKPSDKELVKQGRILDMFKCHLSVYLDSSVDAAYPIKPFVYSREYTTTLGLIYEDLPNLNDSQLDELLRSEFDNRVILGTTNFNYYNVTKETANAIGLTYLRVLTDAFKGVSYVEFSPLPCTYLEGIKGKDWHLWLLKPNKGNSSDLFEKYSSDWETNWGAYRSNYIVIPFPATPMEFPETSLAREYNSYLIEQWFKTKRNNN